MKKILVAATALALVGPSTAALADPVQQFSFQLTNVKPDGRFTLLFTSHTFDTTGAVPPPITANYVRAPAGAHLRKEFLTGRYFCDGQALRAALDARLNGVPFTQRVANLKPFIKSLAKSKSPADRKALANAQACDRARIGSGTVQVDARNFSSALSDLIPGKFSMFLSRGAKGAVAGFAILGAADENAPIVKRYPVVAGVHVALTASFYNDPSPDGVYGYKLVLPVGPINGVNVSLAQISAKTSGLAILKGACLKKNKRGRCTSRQKKTIFWFTQPTCPPSGKLSFQAFYAYPPPTPSVLQTVQLACPKFSA